MRELKQTECQAIQGGSLTAAILTGAAVTFMGWVSIIYNKDALYQLYKIDNVALVSGLGAIVGGLSYTAGILL
ncbi:hypothetical protein [Candidatus Berkiella aquae]|uniref:Uncharacterized protein n=1 Tax=Candidatus Berkiella aquae TaxID=295108 RepID=A0A0Q9YWW2_9GAMM|nr:hypothetical protein [Candidatus Berkiella aquae]MCS5710225.1 hypothetical protein [Candidatus Berkiella aquae]